MYKIIGKDNLGRDSVADTLVAESIGNEHHGKKMVEALNEGADNYTLRYYMLVPAEQKLWRGMEELI